MSDLVEWLTKILDEDEAAARACGEVYPSPWELSDRGWMAKVQADQPSFPIVAELEQHPTIEGWLGDRLQHIALHDPASVLADIAAKRAIIARHAAVRVSGDTRCAVCIKPEWPCATLHDMATAYADRPGYDESRRP